MRAKQPTIAVVGSGPAGLMAAHVLSQAGCRVTLFEKKRGPGRKLLIAGSSGLNISHEAPTAQFWKFYRGPEEHFKRLFETFPQKAWLGFIHQLGIKTFCGTSRRHFVEGMKASPLLRAWLRSLQSGNVEFLYGHECSDFAVGSQTAAMVALQFANGKSSSFDAVCFALGGGSWEKHENPLRWPAMFTHKGLKFSSFRASNVGFEIRWPARFLSEAEGLPLKRVILTTSRGSKEGDLLVTRYGLEGTPVYHVGQSGPARLDLAPGLTLAQILGKLQSPRENLSPIRRIKKYLSLCPAALALVFHGTPPEVLNDLQALCAHVKRFPIELDQPRPLSEAISSAGGLAFEELTDDLMLKKFPGIFVAGEMLDWDAPTGGFLIQGCASQGFLAAKGILEFLRARQGLSPDPPGKVRSGAPCAQ